MLRRSHRWKHLSPRPGNKKMGPTVLANKGAIGNFSPLDQKTSLSMDSTTRSLDYSSISVNGGVNISLNNGNGAKVALSNETNDGMPIYRSPKAQPCERLDSTLGGILDNTPLITPLLTPHISKDFKDPESNVTGQIFERRWQYFGSSQSASVGKSLDAYDLHNRNAESLRVMTFNALAQSLVDYKYIDNDVEIMSWTTRKLEILKVVRDSRCDIICLQEIDEADYHDFFVAEFKALGYSVIYKKKLQNRLDGIAVLYRPSRFKLLVQRDVEFSSEHGQYDKPQVALVVALEDVNNDVYIVSNTHLLFNKNRGDIKAYQLLMLLNVINEFKAELRERNPIVLMCGDFNITPQSLLYSFLDEGVAVLKNSNPKRISGQYLMFDETYLTSSAGHSDAGSTVGSFKHYADDVYGNVKNAKLPREDEEEEETEQEMEWYIELRNKHSQLFKGDGVVLTATEASTDETDPEHSILLSPLVLKSAYNRDADVEDMKAEPAYTAYHGWQRGCVDYIWYDPQQLVVEAIYEMPLYKRVRAGGNLPNKHWPSSDHFSLISQFKRG